MTQWSKYPFVRLSLPLIAGIVLCCTIVPVVSFPLWVPVIAVIGLILLPVIWKVFSSYRGRWLTGIPFNAAIVLLGYSLAAATFPQNKPKHFSNLQKSPEIYIARVDGQPVEKDRSFKVVLSVNEVQGKEQTQETEGKVLCYFSKDSLHTIPEYGDVIVFGKQPVSPSSPGNPGEFNYKSYLEHNGIFHTVYLKSDEFKIVSKGEGNAVKAFAIETRNRFLILLSTSGLSSSELPVAAALLAGYDEMLDAEQRNEYSGAGVIHILCVSGLHVGVIYLLAEMIFSFLRKSKRFSFLRPVFIILIIWLYALITGLAPPVLRASLMFTLIMLGRSSQKQFNTFNTLAAAAFILLVLDPPVLFNVGFQLSFTAVLGIITFQPYLRKLWRPKNPIVVYSWDLVTASLAAQILTTPFILYYFHRFPTYFLFANIAAIPLSGIIIYTGVLLLFTSGIPVFGHLVSMALTGEIRLLNKIVAFIENLPGAVISNIHLSFFITCVLFVLIISSSLYFIKARKAYLWPVMVCILILTGAASMRQINLNNQRKIVFHKASGHPLVSFIDGRKQIILTDSTLLSDISVAAYYLDGLTVESGLEKPALHSLSLPCQPKAHYLSSLPEFYTFKGKRLVFIYGNCILPDTGSTLNADYVLLCKNPWVSLEEVTRCFPDARVIADNTSSYRKAEEWKVQADSLNIDFYDLRKEGALVVELND
jgi:competence protein ComEC